jgi:hypothetical protein
VRGEGERRTYGIWGFVAAFALLGLVGMVLLLLGVASGGGTSQVPTRQTLPDRATSTTSTSTTQDTSVAQLPDGVTEVLSEGGTTSYVFGPPTGADTTSLQPAVAPTTVRVADDGRTATLAIGCARSSEEFLAQVVVTEGDQTVTFASITVAPPGAPPCAPGAATRQVELGLVAPVADRAVVVVPPGAEVPSLPPG